MTCRKVVSEVPHRGKAGTTSRATRRHLAIRSEVHGLRFLHFVWSDLSIDFVSMAPATWSGSVNLTGECLNAIFFQKRVFNFSQQLTLLRHPGCNTLVIRLIPEG